MSLNTLESIKYPNEIALDKAAVAWGVTPEELQKHSIKKVWSSNEIKKFLLKNTNFSVNHKPNKTLKEFFVRFMVLSLSHPLLENPMKAILELLEKDYLKESDIALLRKKFGAIYPKYEESLPYRKEAIRYYKESTKDYIAQFPKRVLLESAEIFLLSERFDINSNNPNPQMLINLIKCQTALNGALFSIPSIDKLSDEIINSNPFLKSVNPILGSLRLRKPVADRHTALAINE